ncbi:hypothetical protein ROHU_001059 [Labeo rohita]|uniref:Uncharacterized protein n=1 Tax=Labeo rohita TaxID=84645 RepID=A0A498P2R3_LABRO|nr:hypothetical protein ROHU_001059 [Labeo rohita]
MWFDLLVDKQLADSGLSSAAVAGICVGVPLTAAAAVAGVIYYRNRQAEQNVNQNNVHLIKLQGQEPESSTVIRRFKEIQYDGVTYSSVRSADNELEPAANELSNNGNANASETSD